MKIFKHFILIFALKSLSGLAIAQAPMLPRTNLGISNMLDGSPPGTGWYFQEKVQNTAFTKPSLSVVFFLRPPPSFLILDPRTG